MNKYIVKNCPACYNYEGKYGCEDNHDKEGRDTYCECITNCVIKQIVEKCKKVQELEYQKGRLKCKSPSKAKFGREILKLLDIQEVE